jgi:heavy metal translocating P-type ATPase
VSATEVTPSAQAASCCGTSRDDGARTSLFTWLRLVFAAFLAGNGMVYTLAVNLSEMSPEDRRLAWWVLAGVCLVVVGLVGGFLVRGIAEGFRTARWSFEALFLAGILGASGYSIASMIRGEGAVYFEVVAILLVIYALGRRVKTSSQARVLRAAEAWSPEATSCFVVAPDGELRPRAVRAVRPGDRVRVFPGQMIPVDGRVVDGRAFVREAEMTGEPSLAARVPGHRVFAGTHTVDGTLTIEAESPGDARRVDAIVAAVEAAKARPARIQRQADRFARAFFPAVSAVALATFLAWTPALGWQNALVRAMAVLVVACPCALGFATPVGLATAVTRLARRGLVVRDGEAIERLAHVDEVLFDKTGTLTDADGAPAHVELLDAERWPAARVVALVAAAERSSDHPYARRIESLAEAIPRDETRRLSAVSSKVLPARGLDVVVEDRGRGERHRVAITRWDEPGATAEDAEAALAVHIDQELVARITIDEAPLPGLDAAVVELRALGLRVGVLSGDAPARVARLGEHGVDEHEAALAPDEKAARVSALTERGRRVLFVGDGVNDASALAAADVGIAVHGGSAIAVECAEIAWHGRNPAAIASAVRIARETLHVVRTNLVFAASYNVLGMLAAAAGFLHPALAATLMLGSSLFVTMRAGRLAEER